MSVLVVGVSHKSAPVALLERLAISGDGIEKLIDDALTCHHVGEAAVIATCNRLEIYAEVDRFHGSVEELSRLLVDRADSTTEAMLPYLYVHYDDGAVSHLFHVVAGLESMALGEAQILGQAREALRVGQEIGSVGPSLNVLFQQALRVGKRSRAETDVDRVAPSLVSASLDAAGAGNLRERRVLVVGAGSMASLAVSTAAEREAAEIVIANRTSDKATRLATEYAARVVPLSELSDEMSSADVVITCTGATGSILSREMVEAARVSSAGLLTLVDLALPHDIEPTCASLDGVVLVNLAGLAETLRDTHAGREIVAVRSIVADEISSFLTARRQASVTPTVVALRTMATGVVDTEMERLLGRLPALDGASRAEVLHAMRRIADKLLHQPTVRVKELADSAGAVSYAAALAELFALDPDAVEAVTRAEVIE